MIGRPIHLDRIAGHRRGRWPLAGGAGRVVLSAPSPRPSPPSTGARELAGGGIARGAGWPAGLTLLEVLIAIFVLSIGLLGVAALIPVGRRQIQIGSQYDRAAACGTAAMNELVVRDYLNPEMWMNHRGNTYGPPSTGAAFPTAPYTTPTAWLDLDEVGPVPMPIPPPAVPPPLAALQQIDPTPIARGNSICIDPLFIARNYLLDANVAHQNGVASFPFHLDFGVPGAGTVQEPDADGDLGTSPLPPRMQRVTVRAWSKESNPSGSPPPPLLREQVPPPPPVISSGIARDAIAERIFTWRDEVVFDLPANPARRPVPKFVVAPPPTAGDPSPVLRPQSVAEYSWFATVTPTRVTSYPLDKQPISYRVSVVVCFKRDLNWVIQGDDNFGTPGDLDAPPGSRPAPKERMVWCEFPGGGLGGGAARLYLPVRSGAGNSNGANPDRSDMPRVRPGQWIMLSGWQWTPQIPSADGAALGRMAVFKWYKVASADAELAYQNDQPPNPPAPAGYVGRWYQDVTLVGADWLEKELIDIDGDGDNNVSWSLNGTMPGSLSKTYATIVDGVVGVYETDWTWRPED